MRVGIATGYTSQNIGNAFFQLGGAALLRRACERVGVRADVVPLPDAPGNWTLRRKSRGNPKNDFALLARVRDLDLMVIQGPSLSRHVNRFWSATLAQLRRHGTAIALIGIAFFRYDEDEIRQARELLESHPITAISTRDSRTAELLREIAPSSIPVFDGIDSAFWAPHAFAPPRLDGGPYLAVSFDRYSEPSIRFDAARNEPLIAHTSPLGRAANVLARRSKAHAYLGALIDRTPRPASIGPYTIVRPEHRSNPPMHWKAYAQPNSLMSDEPYSYLTVYANAEITISDRVHACVAALAYGKRAVLLNSTPRSALLDRVAPLPPGSQVRSVDADRLESLRSEEEEFVAKLVIDRV